ncbi:SCO family protein [Candidatus Liberibacter asiaticus]|uniref:Cytochrome-c oxidase assembly factor protein n=2 Tax=Liberibacter asiaticus TaxID=34021 RepID=C6XHL1_LIBAP|nr:SCO family protein [Candidatus Liberibacter asiaticus]ACT56754.1 cytochrome-c oxidase assembly factor protein [Candidatus Liberibacter asiaticus str. psy62]AGH16521.1 cytochrome-c oxidase assembly factor protein [Candidatus Liberibacter asiaticus str. gxpsy]ALK06920.1 SCO family protein [Candidatus Liberibacter asiaticus]ASK52392.1 cytochrome oxidase [Candidatus Liberibacter asiaticus]AWL13715.1 SCO family protein [Candidatus Liberibacter asiaticus]
MKALGIILGTILLAVLGSIAYVSFSSKFVDGNRRFNSDVHLVAQDGTDFSLSSLYIKPSIVFFGFTNCSAVCPTTLSRLDRLLKQVDPTGTLLNAYFITVDPKRDTPEVMKKFVQRFSDRIIGISGDPIDVMRVAKNFRIYVNNVLAEKSGVEEKYFVDHTTALLLFDTAGSIVGVIPYKDDSDSAIEKINRLITYGNVVK